MREPRAYRARNCPTDADVAIRSAQPRLNLQAIRRTSNVPYSLRLTSSSAVRREPHERVTSGAEVESLIPGAVVSAALTPRPGVAVVAVACYGTFSVTLT